MIGQLLLRFVVGGLAVSLFATAGELFQPKTFAGIFGAAPSVAIASLLLLARQEGPERTAAQGGAMAWGALALCAYSVTLALLLRRLRRRAWLEATAEWSVWLLVALGGWRLLLVKL